MSIVLANLIILSTGWDTDCKLAVTVIVGFTLMSVSRILSTNPIKPAADLRASRWLPVYLIGLPAITWQSQTFDGVAEVNQGWASPAHPLLPFVESAQSKSHSLPPDAEP